ncbi:hypothetical protein Q6257_28925, partial [Klebsiella variicola]
VQTNAVAIQDEFFSSRAVISDDVDGAMNSNQELVAGEMGMLAAGFLGGHAVDKKISLGLEGYLFFKFADCEIAAQILDVGEAV